jgi:hypothetical protein
MRLSFKRLYFKSVSGPGKSNEFNRPNQTNPYTPVLLIGSSQKMIRTEGISEQIV